MTSAAPESPSDLLLGAHFSIAGGLYKALRRAAEYQCTALQLFTKNATTWKEKKLAEKEIRKFSDTRAQTGIRHIFSHASYLINIAGPDPKKAILSRDALTQELIRCDLLDIPGVVLHPGAHMEDGVDNGIQRIADTINRIVDQTPTIRTRLLLETTAGQGTGIGHRFEHLAAIMEKVADKSRVGVCLDTCHIFAAGYDISSAKAYRKTMRTFQDIIGTSRLFIIHLNDAKKACGSRVDRHTHIGDGHIGASGFAAIIKDSRLEHIPKIIETPKKKNSRDGDAINLKLLREMALEE
jgi:deoxyribonuclease-4